MNFLSKLALVALVSGSGLFSLAANADCGKIVIADMSWSSATFMAHTDKAILEKGMGCEVELIPGDSAPTSTSMAEKGVPDAAPEMWANALKAALDKYIAEGLLEEASLSLQDGGKEGFYVPKYMVDKYPEMKTIQGVLSRPDLFPDPEDRSRGRLMGCPSAWNCSKNTSQLYKAFGMDAAGFELGDPGAGAGLSSSLAKAYERGEGWFGYYWEPSAILGKYDMVRVDFGVPHNKEEWDNCTAITECADPKPNAWSPSEVFTMTTADLKDREPAAYAYFTKRGFKNAFLNKFLTWMDAEQAGGEEAAEYFLKTHPEVWTAWVDADTAKKIKATL